LAIRERVLGPDDPEVAFSLAKMGILERDSGRYKMAESFLRRALKIREKSLGVIHPLVVDSLVNLAGLHRHDLGAA
jgi:hypothetical protein